MAIDTERKRKSVVAISLYAIGPTIVADATLGSEDRQVVGYGYYGIAAEIPQVSAPGNAAAVNKGLWFPNKTTWRQPHYGIRKF